MGTTCSSRGHRPQPLIGASVNIDAEFPAIRRPLERAYVFGNDNPFAGATPVDLKRFGNRGRALHTLWQRVPVGGALEVRWPPDTPPRIVQGVDGLAAAS